MFVSYLIYLLQNQLPIKDMTLVNPFLNRISIKTHIVWYTCMLSLQRKSIINIICLSNRKLMEVELLNPKKNVFQCNSQKKLIHLKYTQCCCHMYKNQLHIKIFKFVIVKNAFFLPQTLLIHSIYKHEISCKC